MNEPNETQPQHARTACPKCGATPVTTPSEHAFPATYYGHTFDCGSLYLPPYWKPSANCLQDQLDQLREAAAQQTPSGKQGSQDNG